MMRCVVEVGHLLRGFSVNGIPFADFAALVCADHVAEERHELTQILERKLRKQAYGFRDFKYFRC